MPFIRRRTRKQLKREYATAGHAFALAPIGIAAAALLILVIAAAIWLVIWLTTASSGARGNADVTQQHNSGANRVAQNTTLLNASGVVLADQQKIAVQAANIVTQQDRLDLAGLEQNCQTDVATYNADVRSILATGYLPSDLPSSYPTTVCTAATP